MNMQLQSKRFLIVVCIILLSLPLQTVIAVPSSESFDVTVQPIYHFVEPGNTYEYTKIIQITSTDIEQTLSVSWITTSPFLEILYEETIQLDEAGKATVGYSLKTEEAIPSGDYQINYEISNQAGIAYGGSIPVRTYRLDDPDVVDIEVQALSPFNDVRYSEIDIGLEYDGDWHVLTPSINYNHSLRLITGEYRFTITDIITEVQIKDFKSIASTDDKEQFQYIFPLIQFDLVKLSSNEINFVISNFLGIQNAELLLKNPNGDVLANYEFVVNNGNNQFSFPMPKDIPNELELILSVNGYSQNLIIELSDSETSPEEFPLGIIAILPLIGILLVKLVLPRINFKDPSDFDSEDEIGEITTEIEDSVIESDNILAD